MLFFSRSLFPAERLKIMANENNNSFDINVPMGDIEPENMSIDNHKEQDANDKWMPDQDEKYNHKVIELENLLTQVETIKKYSPCSWETPLLACTGARVEMRELWGLTTKRKVLESKSLTKWKSLHETLHIGHVLISNSLLSLSHILINESRFYPTADFPFYSYCHFFRSERFISSGLQSPHTMQCIRIN